MINKKTQRLDPYTEQKFLDAIVANEILCSIITYPEDLTGDDSDAYIREIELEAKTRARLQLAPITALERTDRGPVAYRMIEALLLSEKHLRGSIEKLYSDEL